MLPDIDGGLIRTSVALVIHEEWVWQGEEGIVGGFPAEVQGSEIVKGTSLRVKHLHFQLQHLVTQHRKLEEGRG